jgi:outer membrane immunogenic protein
MTCQSPISALARARSCRLAAAAMAMAVTAAAADRARAADMPEDTALRGSFTAVEPAFVRWDGLYLGGHVGYANMSVDFSGSNSLVELPKNETNSAMFGGFIGYNIQWDELVVGFDGEYSRPSSLATLAQASGGGSTAWSSWKLVDYAAVRARAGYAFGQFLPYAFLGGGVGRINHSTIVNNTVTASRDNAYTGAFVAGLGVDVALLPNVFVRGEWEYAAFSVVSGTRSSLNTAKAGLAVRF